MACGFTSHAVTSSIVEQQASADRIIATLGEGQSASDSIRILYDAFDLAPMQSKSGVAWKILDIARRTGDDESQTYSVSCRCLRCATVTLSIDWSQ